jgi:hypothetical protein
MKATLAVAALTAGLFCSSAQAVVIPAGTTTTFQFSALPLSQPNTLQVNPAAGLGATVLPGQNVIISLFGEPGDATPFHQADWFTFDGTGFNPDAWFDGTAATRIITFTPALSRSDPVPPNGSFSSYF